jgi:hypothetical protein
MKARPSGCALATSLPEFMLGKDQAGKPMVGFGDRIFNPDEPAANEPVRYASRSTVTCHASLP